MTKAVPRARLHPLGLGSVAVAVLLALGLLLAPPAAPAKAVGFVRDLGRAGSVAVGTTLTITTTGDVTAGNSIIVVASNDGFQDVGTLSCSDSANNTYTTDVLTTYPFTRVGICSAHAVSGLPAGSSITMAWSGAGLRRGIAAEFSGLAGPYLDRTASTGAALQFGTAHSSGPAPTTSYPRELLVGGTVVTAGIESTDPVYTAGTNGTANPCTETGTPTYTALPGIGSIFQSAHLQYCGVTATGAYESRSSTDKAVNSVAALATYRMVDPPVVTTTDLPLGYAENAGAVVVDASLSVTHVDPINLSGATVAISGGFVPGEDTLGFMDQGGITGSYDAATGVLTLTGSASTGSYQAALRSVTYANASDTPHGSTRTVTFQVTDARGLDSTPAPRHLAVVAVNDPPTNTVPAGQATPVNTPLVFASGNGNAIAVADPDAGSGSLRMTLGVTSGTLTLGGTSGLAVTGNGTGAVTATGTVADLNAGLQGLTFTPQANVSGPVTLTVTTNDQANTGAGGAMQDRDTVSITVSDLPTPTPTVTPTPTATGTPTPTLTESPVATPTVTPLATTTVTPTPTSTVMPMATPTVTATPTFTAVPRVERTPTATPTPEPVRVSVTRAGVNRLLVTITARGTVGRVEWAPVPNVAVELTDGTPVNGVLVPPRDSSTAVFYVRKLSGSSATLPLTVTGSFGTWRTFVGGGPDAW